MIVRGPLVASGTGRKSGRRSGDGRCKRCGGRRDRGRLLLCGPRLGLDRGDARGVQALLMPEARDEAATRSCGRGELSGALLCRGGESVQLRCLFGEPRVERGELRPCLARLLDDPVVLAGGAAEAVEPGERLVERARRPAGPRAGRPGPAVRRARGRAPRAATRSVNGLLWRSRAALRSRRGPARPASGARRGRRDRLVRGEARSRARTARASRRSRALSREPAPARSFAACARGLAESAARAIGTVASRAKPVKTATRRAAPLVEYVPTRSRTVASLAACASLFVIRNSRESTRVFGSFGRCSRPKGLLGCPTCDGPGPHGVSGVFERKAA